MKSSQHLRKKVSKILLISPQGKITITKEGSRERKLAVPPLGLAYLAANLVKHGYEVEILDTLIEDYNNESSTDENTIVYGLGERDIKEWIKKSNPDLIGVSSIISNRSPEVLNICRIAKEVFPDVHIVVGGQHPSGMPEMINDANIDYLLSGEADNTFIELLEAVNKSLNLKEVKGIIIDDAGKIFKNQEKDFPDVKILPRPAWDFFSLEKYWQAGLCDYEIGEGKDIP